LSLKTKNVFIKWKRAKANSDGFDRRSHRLRRAPASQCKSLDDKGKKVKEIIIS